MTASTFTTTHELQDVMAVSTAERLISAAYLGLVSPIFACPETGRVLPKCP